MTENIRILLINPPQTGRMVFPSINDQIAFRMHDFAPPLGLLYIKSYLEKYSRAQVSVFNFQTPEQPSMDQFISHLKDFSPDIAGISVISPFWYGTCLVTEAVKIHLPDTLLVGGGPHMWTYPEETLTRGKFNLIVQGQGEKPFLEVINRIACSRDITGIPGTAYLASGQLTQTPSDPIDRDALDALPFPDRKALNIRQHHFYVNKHNPCALMVASRGCPYLCSFCNNRERYFLPRDVSLTIAEMAECKNMGYRSVQFCDDVFTFSREHTIALCEEIKNRKIRLPWSCQTRVDCVDRELLGLMVNAGCERIQFGIESANQDTLDRINKKISPEQSIQAFSLCREQGIITVGNFIIGFPWETVADVKKTFDFVTRLDADFVFCNPLVPFPGTQIYEEACRDSQYDNNWFKGFVENPTAHAKISLWSTHISEAEICILIKNFYRKYYFQPRRIKRYLFNVDGMDDIVGKFKTGIKLILYR